MYAVDLHVHSRFFHGFGPRPTAFDPLGARLATALAARRNLDGLAFTNHDYRLDRSGGGDGGETAPPDGTAAPSGSVVALPGVEVSTTHGHLLIVGPDPPTATEPGVLSPDEAVSLAHERDCAAVLAHPFRNSAIRETDAQVDAVEVNGKHPDDRERVRRLARERDVPLVGGSDAHYPFEVGRAVTRVDAPALTPSAVVGAIRDGRVDPVLRRYPVDRLLTPLYRRIHRVKGHTS